MEDEHTDPLTPHEAFLHALNELIEEYLDTAIEEARTPDAEWDRAVATGWDAGRAAALQELKAYDSDAHDLASCRCWSCEAVQIMAVIWWTPMFGRS